LLIGFRTLEPQGIAELATCAITELGFVRVLAQSPEYGLTVADARSLLLQLKTGTTPKFTFLVDSHDISHLPTWVNTGRRTTDGHLVQLAGAHGLVFATLDEKILGVYLIPA
jgi:uncharacterized protein